MSISAFLSKKRERMRYAWLIAFIVAFTALISGQVKASGQSTSDDSSEQDVRTALIQASEGTYTSWGEKALGKLGDRSAVEVTKIFGDTNLDNKDIRAILLIIKLSFGSPNIIVANSDRQPRTTLFLLRYLNVLTVDSRLKQQISDTQALVEQASKIGTLHE